MILNGLSIYEWDSLRLARQSQFFILRNLRLPRQLVLDICVSPPKSSEIAFHQCQLFRGSPLCSDPFPQRSIVIPALAQKMI